MKNKIGLISIGLIIGLTIGYFVFSSNKKKSENKGVNRTVVSSKKATVSDTEYQYLNPLVHCLNFKTMYYSPMLGFRTQLIHELDSIKEANPDCEIAFYFRDLANGSEVLYNENARFTPASLMKVLVLMSLLKEEDQIKGSLDFKVRYNGVDIKEVVNTDEFTFVKNKLYTLRNLAEIMIEYSDNHATKMIIDFIGFEKIKNTQEALNIKVISQNTLDERILSVKTYATAFRSLYNASYLSRDMSEYALSLLSKPRYGYGIRAAIPEEIPVAHKFGERFIGNAEDSIVQSIQLHHFGIVYREGKPYLIGMMTRGKDLKKMEHCIERTARIVDREIVKRIDQIKKQGLIQDAE